MPAKAACQALHESSDPPLSQASQLPHSTAYLSSNPVTCGSGLARESGVSVSTRVGWPTAIAGQPAPTFDRILKVGPDPLWERACSRRRCVRQYMSRRAHRDRRQASSHRGVQCSEGFIQTKKCPARGGAFLCAGLTGRRASLCYAQRLCRRWWPARRKPSTQW